MHPRLFQFGHVAVPTAAVFTAIAIVVALFTARITARRLELNPETIWDLCIAAVLTAVIAPHLILVFLNWNDFVAHPLWLIGVINVRSRPAVLGGMALAIAVMLIFAFFTRLPFRRTLDALAPPLAIGFAIVNLGAFAGGSDFGTPTMLPWAVTYTRRLSSLWYGTPLSSPLHPVQLYAAFAELCIFALLLAMISKRHKWKIRAGEILGAWLFLHGAGGFFLNFLRGDLTIGAFLFAEILAVSIVLAGGALWLADLELPREQLNYANMPHPESDLKSGIVEMANDCYGYGRWDAPYWFIGPEEGMSATLDERIQAWRDLGRETGLTDCKEFHARIKQTQFHREKPAPRLESTWQWLMLLLSAYVREDFNLNEPIDKATEQAWLREYQRDHWGRADERKGQTCVIEVSGLPAKDLRTGKKLRDMHFTHADYEEILQRRIEHIGKRLIAHDKTPRFVVMYGLHARAYYESLVGCSLEVDRIEKRGSAFFLLTEHPVAPLEKTPDLQAVDKYARWMERGRKLRLLADRSR